MAFSEQTGMKQENLKEESAFRSFLKALSWRGSGFIVTYLLVSFFTENRKIAVEIGAMESVIKIFIFYFHERVWNKITFGRAGHLEKQ
jgi:uncharacterized membrane protein